MVHQKNSNIVITQSYKIKRADNKKIWLILFVVLFLFSRLYNLTLLPIFTDESIYIYWAKQIIQTNSNFFISLTDGKPPLLIWTIALFLKIFPTSLYLIAARLPSVIYGGASLFGIYYLTKLLFNSEKTALMASFLYIISPFTLLYDRLALFDSMLSAMLVWSVYFALLCAKTRQLKHAFFWGTLLGLALLSKSPALIFWFITPVTVFILLLFDFSMKNMKKLILLSTVALIISQAMYATLRFSRVYYLFVGKNATFQRSISEAFANPYEIMENLQMFFSWIISYYTMPFFLLGIISFIVLFISSKRNAIILSLLWFVPIIAFSIVGKVIFPRYIVFTTHFLIIAIAFFVSYLFGKKKIVKAAASLVGIGILFMLIRFDYLLLTAPYQAPLPKTDYRQFISDSPSGYGLRKVYRFLDRELEKNPVTLVTVGTFGLLPYAINLNYWDNSDMIIISKWPIEDLEKDIYNHTQSESFYILFNNSDKGVEKLDLRHVLSAQKPGGENALILAKPKF